MDTVNKLKYVSFVKELMLPFTNTLAEKIVDLSLQIYEKQYGVFDEGKLKQALKQHADAMAAVITNSVPSAETIIKAMEAM